MILLGSATEYGDSLHFGDRYILGIAAVPSIAILSS